MSQATKVNKQLKRQLREYAMWCMWRTLPPRHTCNNSFQHNNDTKMCSFKCLMQFTPPQTSRTKVVDDYKNNKNTKHQHHTYKHTGAARVMQWQFFLQYSFLIRAVRFVASQQQSANLLMPEIWRTRGRPSQTKTTVVAVCTYAVRRTSVHTHTLFMWLPTWLSLYQQKYLLNATIPMVLFRCKPRMFV